ncbi:MAG: DUF202 domain-containing protein [Humidesulfovibrio sp.]|nr:DUF202 domain-containing protein [Humidesulfovibrio sp.]
MNGTLHQRFINSQLNLTEHLAAARSILANERTFLAYQRTALTELAVAATFIHFFDHPALTVIGWILVPASVLTIAIGLHRFRRMHRLIHLLETRANQPSTPEQPPTAE